MNNINKFLLHIALIILSYGAFSQRIIIFNPSPDFFLLHKGIQNVSSFRNENFEANINYKNRVGQLSDIRDLYLDLSIPLNSKQWIGTKVYSEQETSLFTKSKLELFYVNRLKLNDHISLSLGAQGGLANINFESTDANTGGSASGLDLTISSLLEINQFEFGTSLKQIPQTKLRPINYEFVLSRYVESYLAYDFILNESLNLEIGTNGVFLKDNLIWQTNAQLVYQDQYGVILKYGKNFNFSGGAFASFEQENFPRIKLGFSFSNSYYAGIPNTNSLSVFMSLSKK